MKMSKPSVGFWLLTAGLLLSVAGFVLYFMTYDALGYNQNYWVIAMMIIAFWSIACLLINGLFAGNKPFFMDIFYAIAVFAVVIAMLQFLTPCLSPIGIYFTVHNMGDVEANAIGVPRCIAGIILFVLAVACLLAAAFVKLVSDKKGGNEDAQK